MNKSAFVIAVFAILGMSSASCSPQKLTAKSRSDQLASWTDKDFALYFTTIRKGVAVATPAFFARAIAIRPVNEVPIPPCGTTAPSTSRVVKMRIGDGFDVKDTGREAFVKYRVGGGRKDVPEPAHNVDSTTYDLNLDTSVWAGSASKYIAVSIFLKDDYLSFLNDEISVTTVGAAGMFYCLENIKRIADKDDGEPEDDKPSTTGHDWQVATFYVDGTVKGKQKFNIRLSVRHKKHNPQDFAYVLPIIVDPVVDNNGYN